MARGKKSLLETTDLPIIKTDIEEGTIPYFIIDEEYGIACDERNEILVHKRNANRTIKGIKNENDHIEQYIMWDNVCYPRDFSQAIELYSRIKGLKFKKKLCKSKDFNDLIKIQHDIKDIIYKSLQFDGTNKEFLSVTSILDERSKLEEQLQLLRETKEKVEKETDSLMELIKQKRSIIIKNTEPTKHKNKIKEEE